MPAVLLRRIPPVFCLLAAVFLNACATRPTPLPQETSLAAETPDKSAPPFRRGTASEVRPVSLRESVEMPPAIKPITEPTRAEKIIRLVRNGGLVQADRNTLVFSRFRTAPPVSAGLYEDGITLGRLRRQLKQIPNLPASVSASARVNGARAYLNLPEDISCEAAAEAVDAALKTEGTSAVHARLFSPASSS